jgi:magnesium transporter
MATIDAGKVTALLDKNKANRLRKIILEYVVPDIAVLVDQLSDRHKLQFYLLLPTQLASDVLLEVSPHSRKFILKSLKDKYIVTLIESAESDDSADILGEVPEHKAVKIFANLTEEKKEAIAPLIKHEEDTAGGLMKSELVSLHTSVKVSEAVRELKKTLRKVDGANYVYVVDGKGRLKGVISMHGLITSPPDKTLGQVMEKKVVKLRPELDKEKVAAVFRTEDILSLPVVDREGNLLGRVTVDDVLDVMEDEATEDMFKIAGVHPDENIFDPFRSSLRRRLPWLILNLGTAILAAITVSLFKDTLQAVVILAAFMPIVAGMGGNAGTQTLTLVVRGLALNQLNLQNYKKVILKELSLGLFNGVVTGLIMAVIAYFWVGNPMIGVVILLAMMINLFVAGFIGTAIPIVLKLCKVDPAVASTVFLTTFTDIVGFFSLLGIATLLIHWLV